MPSARLTYLFEQYLAKSCTAEEKQELAEMILISPDDADIRTLMQKAWDDTGVNELMPTEKVEEIFSSIIKTNPNENPTEPDRKVRRLWIRYAAAACVALLIGFGWYTLTNKPENLKPTVVAQTNDVKPPTSNRAMITLANGQTVYLDSVNNGTLAQQGNVSLQKLADGKIAYNGTLRQAQDDIAYNTLTNPRGSRVIDMTLSDGTRVWLNAGSSVTYPVAFVGKERKVTMNGEAYFEVVHNTAMPFKVNKGDVEVTVLGTHFNVNAYDDETSIKVTLLEGSVKTSIVNGESSILKPGEQAFTSESGKWKIQKNADLNEVMAWKDGRFYFDGADIKTVMRQLARWYDVEVDYKATINYSFVAKISRDVPVSQLLKLLELTEGVHFKVEGNKITVMR